MELTSGLATVNKETEGLADSERETLVIGQRFTQYGCNRLEGCTKIDRVGTETRKQGPDLEPKWDQQDQ